MNTPAYPSSQRHRFPVESISHAVWLYVRFSLRYRDGEELMAARGIVLSYGTIRQWLRDVWPALCEPVASTTWANR